MSQEERLNRLRQAGEAARDRLDFGPGTPCKRSGDRAEQTNQEDCCWSFHHLAIDSVSWRPLVSDLEEACAAAAEGREIILRGKSAGFRQWADALKASARARLLRARLLGLHGNARSAAADCRLTRAITRPYRSLP